MPTDAELRAQFWTALRSDRTVMLGLAGDWPEPPRPMTALIEGDSDHGPLWFFTSKDTQLAEMLTATTQSLFTFASKGHDVFATVHGNLTPDTDRARVDSLWSPFVAAWYPGGKDDPNLLLLRFDPVEAEIWQSGTTLMAGLKMLLGADMKQEYQDKVTKGPLS